MTELLIIVLIAFFSGFVKGTSGFGSSLVALPLLTMYFELTDVVLIMITYNVLLNTFLVLEHKQFAFGNIKQIWLITLFGVFFTAVGAYVLNVVMISEVVVRIIAILLLTFAIINALFDSPIRLKETKITQMVVGAFSGFGNGIASIDGPPVVFYLSAIRADKVKFKSTLGTHFLILGVLSVLILAVLGAYTKEFFVDFLYIAGFATLGAFTGIYLSRFINEGQFKKIIVGILIALTVWMTYQTIGMI